MAITRPIGFRVSTCRAQIKPSGRPDFCVLVCDPPTEGGLSRFASAGAFTNSSVVGAPITIGRAWQNAGSKPLRAIVINAGNANAATGSPGVEDAIATCKATANELGCDPSEVLPSSTGVIGRRLPIDRMLAEIPGLISTLARGEEADLEAANAIRTTDLVPKQAHRELELDGHVIHLGAITKGSGMIAPRFGNPPAPQATMLGFITTDAWIESGALQTALNDACRRSFERVSVDAHTSCSDMAVVMASGHAHHPRIEAGTPQYEAFAAALRSLCTQLAEQIARDGEGATRIFRVNIHGAPCESSAERIARFVVDSPLVKCAIHGRDPNWGRIVTAAGNAGVHIDEPRSSLLIGGVAVYRAGVPLELPKDHPPLVAAMNADPVELDLTVGDGPGNAWMMGCDLSAQYVKINAEYTT